MFRTSHTLACKLKWCDCLSYPFMESNSK